MMINKCIKCGGTSLRTKTEPRDFDGVAVVDTEVTTCADCGEESRTWPNIGELMEVLASGLARRDERLSPREARFLRSFLGLQAKDFATYVGVAPETVSRWENANDAASRPMPLGTEKLLRLLVVQRIDHGMVYLPAFASAETAEVLPSASFDGKAWTVRLEPEGEEVTLQGDEQRRAATSEVRAWIASQK